MPLITSGLVADWQFAEGTGNTTADSSGNGHTLTSISTPGDGNAGNFPVWTPRGVEMQAPGQCFVTDVPGTSVLTLQILGKYKGVDIASAICGMSNGGTNPMAWGFGSNIVFSRQVPRVENDPTNTITNGLAVYQGTTLAGNVTGDVFLANASFEISYTHPGSSGDIIYRGATRCFGGSADTSTTGRDKSLTIGYSFSAPGSFNRAFLGEIYRVVVYNRALTANEIATNSAYYTTWAQGRGVTLNELNPSTNPVYLADGDSITQGLGADVFVGQGTYSDDNPSGTWCAQITKLLPNGGATMFNGGIGGQNIQTMSAAYSRFKWLYAPNAPYNFCTVMGGTNDQVIGTSVTDVFNYCVTLVNAYASIGFIGAVLPMLDKKVSSGGDVTFKNAYNSMLAAHTWPTGWKFIDPTLFPDLVPDGKANTVKWFADGTHPTQVGNNEMARAVLLGYYGTTQAQSYLPTSSVKINVDRGDGGLGTYDGSDRWSDPGVQNVAAGIAYKANSTSNNRTGTVTEPTAEQVQAGVHFGAGGTQYTGTYVATAGAGVTLEEIGDLLSSGIVTLAPTAFDEIPTTPPADQSAPTFREMVVMGYRRWFRKFDGPSSGNGPIRGYADDGSTVLSSQPYADDGEVQSQGAAS